MTFVGGYEPCFYLNTFEEWDHNPHESSNRGHNINGSSPWTQLGILADGKWFIEFYTDLRVELRTSMAQNFSRITTTTKLEPDHWNTVSRVSPEGLSI